MCRAPRKRSRASRPWWPAPSAFDKDRGDNIEVSSIAFGSADMNEGPSLVKNFLDLSGKLGKPLLTGLLIFLFLILVVRPVVMALIRPKVAEQEVEEVASLPSTEDAWP
jgi:hypothetical protein